MLIEAQRAESPKRRHAAWTRLTRAFVVLLALSATSASADDPRSTYLIKLLQGSTQFRVRAQAAISLGAIEGSEVAVGALVSALRDAHPAVRAAAATSLGRVGDASVIAKLKALERDPEEPVRVAARTSTQKLEKSAPSDDDVVAPAGPPLYYVAIAEPATQVSELDKKMLAQARTFIRQRIGQIQGVRLAPDTETSQAAEQVLKSQRLKGFYLNSSITSVEKKPTGETRIAVSIIVATYPGRDMRAIMQGAASVSGAGSQTYTQAMEGAFSGALRNVNQAFSR